MRVGSCVSSPLWRVGKFSLEKQTTLLPLPFFCVSSPPVLHLLLSVWMGSSTGISFESRRKEDNSSHQPQLGVEIRRERGPSIRGVE